MRKYGKLSQGHTFFLSISTKNLSLGFPVFSGSLAKPINPHVQQSQDAKNKNEWKILYSLDIQNKKPNASEGVRCVLTSQNCPVHLQPATK